MSDGVNLLNIVTIVAPRNFSLRWPHMLRGDHDDVLCSVFCIMEQDSTCNTVSRHVRVAVAAVEKN